MINRTEILEVAKKALSEEANALEIARSRLGQSMVDSVQAILASDGKVVVTGLGKSGHVGRKIAATLASTGTSAFFLHPSEALHGDFGMIQAGDVLLAIAYGGETHEVNEVCKYVRRTGGKIIAITGKKESSLGQLAHFVLNGGVDKEADPLNIAPTSSSTVAIGLGDALAVSLMHARGFTIENFASLHPGGSLGRKLSMVKDHMHGRSGLPEVHPASTFNEVLTAVTVDNFGIVAVVNEQGELVGAVSDGDLRRVLLKLGAKALEARAQDIMSPKPVTILDHELAIDAVRLMNERRISRLFVTSRDSGQKPLGLIRLQDLLAAKVI